MRVTTLTPGPALAPFVRALTIVETRDTVTRVLVPDTGLVMGFRYGGRADLLDGAHTRRVPDISLSGLRHSARHMRTSAGGGVILATFHEGAASLFVREPLHELFGESVTLTDVLPAVAIECAAERIARAETDRARVAALERFLLDRRLRREVDLVAVSAARAIRATGGAIRIRTLADRLGLSVSRFEERFRQAVGASPKAFASIVRLRSAIDAYRSGDTLAQVSAVAGYADQSHFTRDFRGRMGAPPRRLLGSDEYC